MGRTEERETGKFSNQWIKTEDESKRLVAKRSDGKLHQGRF